MVDLGLYITTQVRSSPSSDQEGKAKVQYGLAQEEREKQRERLGCRHGRFSEGQEEWNLSIGASHSSYNGQA